MDSNSNSTSKEKQDLILIRKLRKLIKKRF